MEFDDRNARNFRWSETVSDEPVPVPAFDDPPDHVVVIGYPVL